VGIVSLLGKAVWLSRRGKKKGANYSKRKLPRGEKDDLVQAVTGKDVIEIVEYIPFNSSPAEKGSPSQGSIRIAVPLSG